MNGRRPGPSFAGALILVLGLGSGAVLAVVLGRQVAYEREKRERAETDVREGRLSLEAARHEQRAAKDRVGVLETDRENRARVVEGEIATLRRDLAVAVKERDAAAQAARTSAAERDRAQEDLVGARREEELLRGDLARAVGRAAGAEAAAREKGKAAEDAERRLAALSARVGALLRPLLQDLRSGDGSLRVRAHEALCAWAGKELPFRPNGTPEQIEADARAIEEQLSR